MSYYAESYADARGRFLTAAIEAGAQTQTFVHPTAKSPNGSLLAIDLARLGHADAENVLFTVSGTHGVEGYAGSAAQIALLRSGKLDALPEHVAVVILHGLNPWGWSRDSQRNEDGIDINRNFIDFSKKPARSDPLHQEFAAALDNDEMSFSVVANASQRIFALREKAGNQRFMDALAGGQYDVPRGLKFGGSAQSWSNTVYRQIVRRYLSSARRVAYLDWHTGLGDYGGVFPLCFCDQKSRGWQLTCDWWGEGDVKRGAASWATEGDRSPAPKLSGLAQTALADEAPHAAVAGGIVEFGTVPFGEILSAVVVDHWLNFKSPHNSNAARYWRAQMRTYFAPRDPFWERSVAAHAERLFANTLAGLVEWRN